MTTPPDPSPMGPALGGRREFRGSLREATVSFLLGLWIGANVGLLIALVVLSWGESDGRAAKSVPDVHDGQSHTGEGLVKRAPLRLTRTGEVLRVEKGGAA